MKKRVVVTGIAPVAAIGSGKEFFENLFAKKIKVNKLPEDYCVNYTPQTKWIVPYPAINYKDYGKEIMRMSMMAPKNACTAVISALMALKDASIEQPDPDTAVMIGVGFPNFHETSVAYDSMEKSKKMHPCTNPILIINSVSAWISIILGIHGKNEVIGTACAAGTNAIGEAYLHIHEGRGNMAICGGADCFSGDKGLGLRSFDILGALTKTNNGCPYPFSEERSGFLFSEGSACTMVLEDYEHAKARGADIYAEITGYEANCDGHHIVQIPDEPVQIIRMIEKLAKGEHVDYYNAHGTGTPLNDKTEEKVLKTVFNDQVSDIFVTSAKGITGHSMGASGAIEAAICAYSIKHDRIHGNILGTPISGLLLPETSLEAHIDCAITASFGFGGHNAALKFRKVTD